MGFRVPPRAKAPLKVARRLASFVDTWKVLTKDTWVLDSIQGYQIPLLGKPYQPHRPQEGVFSQEQATLIKEEVGSLLQKGAIPYFPNTLEGFTLFLVPKKNGQMRPVINPIEQVGRNPTLQNGGHPNLKRPVENKRLDGESRLEGRLLHNPHSQSSPAVPQIQGSRSLLPVHLPPIRPVLHPMDIH